MMPTITRLFFMSLVSFMMLTDSPGKLNLSDLTVASGRLPNGCKLAAAPTIRLDDTRVIGGLWGGLSIRTNPWIGSDRAVLAQIHRHMYGSGVLPDAPPDRRSAVAYDRQLVDNVSEGYAAFYQDSGPDGIAVYALTFRPNEPLSDLSTYPQTSKDRLVSWITQGQTHVLVVGDAGRCADVIQASVQSLARKG